MSLVGDLNSLCNEMHARWDTDMKAGKILLALLGEIPVYDPRVTRIREALAKVDAGGLDAIPFKATHTHVGRGSDYQKLGEGRLQTKLALADDHTLVAYRDADGALWFRPEEEFFDGRFTKATT